MLLQQCRLRCLFGLLRNICALLALGDGIRHSFWLPTILEEVDGDLLLTCDALLSVEPWFLVISPPFCHISLLDVSHACAAQYLLWLHILNWLIRNLFLAPLLWSKGTFDIETMQKKRTALSLMTQYKFYFLWTDYRILTFSSITALAILGSCDKLTNKEFKIMVLPRKTCNKTKCNCRSVGVFFEWLPTLI